MPARLARQAKRQARCLMHGAELLPHATAAAQVFDPWNRRNQFQPSGVAYPAEGGK